MTLVGVDDALDEGMADDIAFVWPVPGGVIETFDEVMNKGVDIAGKMGEPVLAAAVPQVLA